MEFNSTIIGFYSGILLLVGITLINAYSYVNFDFLMIFGFLAIILSLVFGFQVFMSIFEPIDK